VQYHISIKLLQTPAAAVIPSLPPLGHYEKITLRPVRPDALDARDVSDTTRLHRTQHAAAPRIRMQRARAHCVRARSTTACAYRVRSVRAFSFQTQPCQAMFLPDAAASSSRSHGILTQRVASWPADTHYTLAT
jgi:hypothetical protein